MGPFDRARIKTSLIVLSVFLLLAVSVAAAPASDINSKVARLNIGKATLPDVIRIFGRPTKYISGNQTFSKKNLPSSYVASYNDDIHIVIEQGRVTELRFESPASGFVFLGKIEVGSSLQDVLSAVKKTRKTIVAQPKPRFFSDAVLYKDINGQTGYCYYARADQGFRIFFLNYNVRALYLTKASRKYTREGAGGLTEQEPVIPEFEDVRFKDLTGQNLSGARNVIETLTFNQKTVWPKGAHMPDGFRPDRLLKKTMNPGLGIRNLHKNRITGKGIGVAIIDQAMYLDHPEFAGKIAAYHDLAAQEETSMHGPAVTSLLIGNNCGTAPDANLYYVAVRSGVHEADYVAGLEWIIEKNRSLPPTQKIRVVCVSAAPGEAGTVSGNDDKKWNDICILAEKENILVLDCTKRRGFIGPCWYDSRAPDRIAGCTPGFKGQEKPWSLQDRILVPVSPRTTAEQYKRSDPGYQYCGKGGLSWAIPYCAGVLALGWQICPEIGHDWMRELIFESAYRKGTAKIINPRQFIRLVRKAKTSHEAQKSK